MSSALKKLTSIGQYDKPYFGFSTLPHGYHEILNFRFMNNKNYKPDENDEKKKSAKRILVVELKDQILFLPEYFALKLNDNDAELDEMNNDGEKKFLYFGGKREKNK